MSLLAPNLAKARIQPLQERERRGSSCSAATSYMGVGVRFISGLPAAAGFTATLN